MSSGKRAVVNSCQLLVASGQLIPNKKKLFTLNISLLTAHCSLLTAHCPLPTDNYIGRAAGTFKNNTAGKSITLIVDHGSYAERYAAENGVKYVYTEDYKP